MVGYASNKIIVSSGGAAIGGVQQHTRGEKEVQSPGTKINAYSWGSISGTALPRVEE
jgi:hypothetical protein